MKKIIICICALLSLAVFAVTYTGFVPYHKPDQVFPEVKQATIYADISSFATLLQMVDLVKSSPSIPKFVFWRRMIYIDQNDPYFKNITVYPSPKKMLARKFQEEFSKAIKKFVDTYPNAKFTVHLNKDQNLVVWAVLKNIPKDRIEHVHYYEESFGFTTFQMGFVTAPPEKALALINRKDPPAYFGVNYALSLIPVFPSTVHLALADTVMKDFPKIKEIFSKAVRVDDVKFNEISKTLTPQQKHNLLRLGGIREKDLTLFRLGKPVMLYTLGFHNDNIHFNMAQVRILDLLFKGKIVPIKNPGNYVWMFKEHPWLTNNRFLHATITKHWPFMHALPKQMPLEVLFLAGYMPDKVFGYSSSLFFALPPDRILFYIERPNDVYIPMLKKAGILTDDKIITLEGKHVSR